MAQFYKKHMFMCTNQKLAGKKCCNNANATDLLQYTKDFLSQHSDLKGKGSIKVSGSGCLGRCGVGPCIVIYPEGVWYTYTNASDIEKIVKNHLLEGKIITELLL